MNLNFEPDLEKNEVFEKVKTFLDLNGFNVINSDQSRPWGGFFVVDEKQSQKFIDLFFKDVDDSQKKSSGKVSPKILIVEKRKRLSWQYHYRRSELWKVIGGRVGVIQSESDVETTIQTKNVNQVITLQQGERHRLIGLDSWGIVAEIWKHTESNHPSDEDDIVRLQDDFGR